ncbi:bifunctional diguanylate cyclase/phosphodiesterase [Azohydromonas aeria]|uniref:bifunctional diguanylate cyclase/phosphodiesterase n=1 Tax=Azohydromonas aeria TaxID=2590212 RepID=UPI0012FA2844|nr:GGDEF domain-containing protein [Azohydromonas aeria]
MNKPRSKQEDMERLERALRTLSGCNRALLRAQEEGALMQEICRVVVEDGGYHLARIGRAEHDADKTVTLLAHAGRGTNQTEVEPLVWSDTERGRSATGMAIRTGTACLVNDAQGDFFPAVWRDLARRHGLGSVLALPLRIEGELFGALTIGAPETDAFSGQERQVLDEVAGDVAFGLEILRLRRRRERAEAEVQRLNRAVRTRAAVNRALAQARDETALLQEICRVAVEECGYRMAWVGYFEHDEMLSVRPMAHAGFEEGFLDGRRNLSWLRSDPERAARLDAGQPMVFHDLANDPSFPLRQEYASRSYGSVVLLPLRVGEQVLGALYILAKECDGFDAQEVELLAATVADLGYGLDALHHRAKALAAEQTIRRMAYFDTVTGLPNRAQLCEVLSEAIAAARDQRRSLALLRIGLTHLAELNETLGSTEVDKLVQAVGERLQQALCDSPATLGRLAEAEFAVVLPRAGAEEAGGLAQRLLMALGGAIDVSGLRLDARANVGISLYPGHGNDGEALLRRAGVALTQGRVCGTSVSFYRNGLDQQYAQRLELLAELREALARDELLLYCQPKVKLDTGKVCGAEALVRWQHPRLGQVHPGDFIKLAEQTGLITPLTYWMLNTSLRYSHAWREQGQECPLSVNLSARDLQDPKLLDRIEGALMTWGAEPDWIEFELTESALMLDPNAALETLGRLKRLELRLAIDDYGTGYSSLSYLQRLPVDAIKIDQSFVSRMRRESGSAAIVRSTIELAHDLRLLVIGEGVEDKETLDDLAALQCDQAQGYCISRPMPAEQFHSWCEARN